MKDKQILPKIKITKNTKYPNIIDITLTNTAELAKTVSAVECTLLIYPFSRNLTANSFFVFPFEEYINDIIAGKRSSYQTTDKTDAHIFGLLLGGLIALFVSLINPNNIFEIESLVSIISVYLIGRELWKEIDVTLQAKTRQLPISWQEDQFPYRVQDSGTIQQFAKISRNIRYEGTGLHNLPGKMDFIEHSNSKTIELLFQKKELQYRNEDYLRICSIHFGNTCLEDLKKDGLLIGIKVALCKKVLCFNTKKEIFQAIITNNNEVGTVDDKGNWCTNTLLIKDCLNFGRLKIYLSNVLKKETIIW